MTSNLTPEKSTLGKKTVYCNQYDSNFLFPISRKLKREQIGILEKLPFFGFDVWNHYEISWLNEKGKPIVAIGKIVYSCDSENIIESKSMKLYFNSFNNTKFKDINVVKKTIQNDLIEKLNSSFVSVDIISVEQFQSEASINRFNGFNGFNIDSLDITCTEYHNHPEFLTTESEVLAETLCTDLLKSNCLVTNQPDWCSVQINYQGKKINREGLLKYIISFRNDNEFHEQCIEKIFMQILERCKPVALTIYGRSTRRGGLDINSYRSTHPMNPAEISNIRLCRQ